MNSDSDSETGDKTKNRKELSEGEIIKRKKEARKRKKERLLGKLEKRKKVCDMGGSGIKYLLIIQHCCQSFRTLLRLKSLCGCSGRADWRSCIPEPHMVCG